MPKRIICFDIEADALVRKAKNIWCICAQDVDTGEAWRFGPKELTKAVKLLTGAHRLVAHNGLGYDVPVVERILKCVLPPCVDTLRISRLMYPDSFTHPIGGNALADWGRHLGHPKTEHDDWSKFSPEMLEYCANDVALGVKIFHYQRKRWAKFGDSVHLEHQVEPWIVRQHINGVSINAKAVQELIKTTSVARARLLDKLHESFPPRIETMKTPAYYFVNCGFEDATEKRFKTKGAAQEWVRKCKFKYEIHDGPLKTKVHEFSPNSPNQIAAALMQKYNWKPRVFTDGGEPKLDKVVLESLKYKYPEAALISEFRMVDDRATTAQKWVDMIDPETGRLHHEVNSNGAVTGRMTHSKPNVNVPKIRKGADKKVLKGLEGLFGYECRSCFVPREGWWQVGADASGLQNRILAHYMAAFDNGEYAKIVVEGDCHEVNRLALEIDSRDDAKTWFYAYIFGAGDGKLGAILKGDKGRGADSRRKFERNLRAMGLLKRWIASEVQTHGRLVGLDGRIFPIRSEHSALNTLVQGGESVVMKKAYVIRNTTIIKKYKYTTDWADMLFVHDEWQSEARNKTIAECIGKTSVAAIRETGKFYDLKCPLDGEYKIGKSWADCH